MRSLSADGGGARHRGADRFGGAGGRRLGDRCAGGVHARGASSRRRAPGHPGRCRSQRGVDQRGVRHIRRGPPRASGRSVGSGLRRVGGNGIGGTGVRARGLLAPRTTRRWAHGRGPRAARSLGGGCRRAADDDDWRSRRPAGAVGHGRRRRARHVRARTGARHGDRPRARSGHPQLALSVQPRLRAAGRWGLPDHHGEGRRQSAALLQPPPALPRRAAGGAGGGADGSRGRPGRRGAEHERDPPPGGELPAQRDALPLPAVGVAGGGAGGGRVVHASRRGGRRLSVDRAQRRRLHDGDVRRKRDGRRRGGVPGAGERRLAARGGAGGGRADACPRCSKEGAL